MRIGKLSEETHFIMDRGKKTEVSHNELLGKIPQVIRLQNDHYNKAYRNIIWGKEISLFNHENNINNEIIKSFQDGKENTNSAMLCRIIPPEEFLKNGIDMRDTSKPLLDIHSMQEVKILEMENKIITDINSTDIKKSIANLGENNGIEEFLQWMSLDFYKNTKTVEELIKTRKLFYRLITLK